MKTLFTMTQHLSNSFKSNIQSLGEWTYQVFNDAAEVIPKIRAVNELDFTDKRLWSAFFAEEMEGIEEEIKDLSADQLVIQLTDLQNMIGENKLSPVEYIQALTEFKMFLENDNKLNFRYGKGVTQVLNDFQKKLMANVKFAESCLKGELTYLNRWQLQGRKEDVQAFSVLETLEYYHPYVRPLVYLRALQFYAAFVAEEYELRKTRFTELTYDILKLHLETTMNEAMKLVLKDRTQKIKSANTENNFQLPEGHKEENINTKALKSDIKTNSIKTALGQAWNYMLNYPAKAITIMLLFQAAAIAAISSKRISTFKTGPDTTDEFEIISTIDTVLLSNNIASLINGNLVILISQEGGCGNYSTCSYAQIITSNGNKVGNAHLVSTNENYLESYDNSIFGLPNSNFLFSHTLINASNTNDTFLNFVAYAELFDIDANPINRYKIFDFSASNMTSLPYINLVKNYYNNNFIAVCEATNQLYALAFDQNGNKINNLVQIDLGLSLTVVIPDSNPIAAFPNNNTIVILNLLPSTSYFQLLDQNLNKSGPLVQVSNQSLIYSIEVFNNNSFLLSTQSSVQLFDSAGTKIKDIVNIASGGSPIANSVILKDSNIMIVTLSAQLGVSGENLYGQLFDYNGKAIGQAFQINILLVEPNLLGSQIVNMMVLNNGNILCVYQQYYPYINPTILLGRILRPTILVTESNKIKVYAEGQNYPLNDIRLYEPIYNVGADNYVIRLAFSDNTAGTLFTIAASSEANFYYNATRGEWHAIGYVLGINDLLAGLQYQPTPYYFKNFTIDIFATDGIGPDFHDTISLFGLRVDYPPTVQNIIPLQVANVGQQYVFTFDTNTFLDRNGGALNYFASLNNNNTLPAWLEFNPLNRTFFSPTPVRKEEVGVTRVYLTAIDESSANITTNFDITVFPSLYVSYINNNFNYFQDTLFIFPQSITIQTASSTVTATLTILNNQAGRLSSSTSGNTTVIFNKNLGVWNASGLVENINNLLANITFNPAAGFYENFPITVLISDGYNYDQAGLISMHGNPTLHPNKNNKNRAVIIGSTFGALGLGLAAAAGVYGIYSHQKNKKQAQERKDKPLANALRTHLNLMGVDDFTEGKGLAFVTEVEILSAELTSQGINVNSMYDNDIEKLAKNIVKVLRVFVPVNNSLFGNTIEPRAIELNAETISKQVKKDYINDSNLINSNSNVNNNNIELQDLNNNQNYKSRMLQPLLN